MSQTANPRPLRYGEPLALVYANANRNPRFALGSLGGRWVLMCVIGELADDTSKAALAAMAPRTFNETHGVGVVFCADPKGSDNPDLAEIGKSKLVFSDQEAARACGLLPTMRPANECSSIPRCARWRSGRLPKVKPLSTHVSTRTKARLRALGGRGRPRSLSQIRGIATPAIHAFSRLAR
jgi:hypothetical protein